MTIEFEPAYAQFVDRYRRAAPDDRALMLLRLAHSLTVHARRYYPLADETLRAEERFDILHDINELQHRIISHSIALLTDDDRRYPDAVLLAMLRPAEQSNSAVGWALNWALREGTPTQGTDDAES
jgi:hypothetical protein